MTDEALLAEFDRLRADLGTVSALRRLIETGGAATSSVPRGALDLVAAVASRSSVTVAALLGRARNRRLDRARTICWYLLHRRFELSNNEIGQLFDGRTRALVRVTVDAVRKRLVTDDVLRATVASFDHAANRREERHASAL
jgi:chromosomal replication initiation ATPase DnaA